MERCLREIAVIEAELRAGNPDVMGLLLALADWHAELHILQGEVGEPDPDRARHAEGSSQNRETERVLGVSDRFAPYIHHINFIDGDGRVNGTMVSSSDPALCVPYQEIEGDRKEAE